MTNEEKIETLELKVKNLELEVEILKLSKNPSILWPNYPPYIWPDSSRELPYGPAPIWY
jgi:hypothetical protein